jgi:hypothetical protein
MRTLFLGAIALASASTLAACAGTGMNSDAQEFAQLQTSCESRGGVFISSGRMTGRPGLDNLCKFNGAATTPPGFERN